jgi:hypothetical protein
MHHRWTPEGVAAAVNGALVFLVPVALAAYASSVDTAVRPEGWPQTRAWLAGLVGAGAVASPFVMVAAWRTWVHARRLRQGLGTGWSGVLEAGALGLALALLVLAPGIVFRPLEAPPYVVAYGGGAVVVGLTIGLVLRGAALIALRFARQPARP